MKVSKIAEATEWFEVLQTGERAQTAMMTLAPGDASGEQPNAHEKSEQILLVLEGEVEAEVAGEKQTLSKGSVVLVPAGVKHRFVNRSGKPAVTFNVYAPPEYPPGSKG